MVNIVTSNNIEQEVLGYNVKNSGRDYIDNSVNNYFDHHTWKQQTPMAVLNQLAIDNEFYFIERFGFDASYDQRRQVIEIKEQFDFTDMNIKVLKRSGALSVKKGQPVTLYSDWIGLVASIILMVLCSLEVALFSTLLFVKGNNLAIEILITVVMSAICFFFVLDLHRLSVKPAKILWENGIKLGNKFTLQY
jgi:hypothetical protein